MVGFAGMRADSSGSSNGSMTVSAVKLCLMASALERIAAVRLELPKIGHGRPT
jgi:hypothetical protein